MPSAWTIKQTERGYFVYNDSRVLMLHLPATLTPIQVRDCAWNHYTTICGGGFHASV